MRVVSLILGIVCLGFAFSASAKPVFMGLGDLPGGDFYSKATAISADGSVVVGHGSTASVMEAFRWTAEGGMVGLGNLTSDQDTIGSSFAYGVSANGSVVVGQSRGRAFRWYQVVDLSDGKTYSYMSDLGILPGRYNDSSRASGVSGDGSIVVGKSDSDAFSQGEAFRWTDESGMVGLGTLPGWHNDGSTASAISTDGAVVVGFSSSTLAYGGGGNDREAFRSIQIPTLGGGPASTLTSIGFLFDGALPGYLFDSRAKAVSADGSVVVGESDAVPDALAFLWTDEGGMVPLEGAGIQGFDAVGVSADGSVVVGLGHNGEPGGWLAFIWDSTNGMRAVEQVITDLGGNLTGWDLRRVTGISADGLTVVGWGTNPDGFTEAWIAHLSCYNGGGDDSDSIPECPGDKDGDSVADRSDNCVADANPEQVDSDADGYGNRCDADYDGDGVVSGRDFLLFRSTYGKRASQRGFLAAADADGDGVIAGTDFLAFRAQYQRGAPGP